MSPERARLIDAIRRGIRSLYKHNRPEAGRALQRQLTLLLLERISATNARKQAGELLAILA